MKCIDLWSLLLVASSTLVALGCKPQAPQTSNTKGSGTATVSQNRTHDGFAITKIQFQDVTDSSGINHTIESGSESHIFGMPEIIGGGVGVIDYDLDGREDLAFAGGGRYPDANTISGLPGTFYRGVDSFAFKDVSRQSNFNVDAAYNHGVMVDDVDADGFDDIAVAGFGAIQLLLNQGDGTFSLATIAMQLIDDQWSTVVAASDINLDGLLDLYVAHYGNWSLQNNPICRSDSLPGSPRAACSPDIFPGIDHKLFVQDGNGLFVNATEKAKLSKGGRGLGILCADFDADGDVDIYVANDEEVNFLYVNDGHGVFTEEAIQQGCATDGDGVSQGSMGVAIGDYQKDGRGDIFVTNFKDEQSALYSARKSRGYRFATAQARIIKPDAFQIGWGTAFVDFELDGDEDIVVTNGHVDWQDPNFKQRANLYVNDQGKYLDLTDSVGEYFTKPWPGRGLAVLDHDGDGLQDLVLAHLKDRSHVLKNVSNATGSYLSVRLIGTVNNRNAIGAIGMYQDVDGSIQIRHRYGGGSSFSTSQKNLHFSTAVKDAKGPIKLSIQWPGGKQESLEIDKWNQMVVVIESPDKGSSSTWFPVR